jgi:hypothetical protein
MDQQIQSSNLRLVSNVIGCSEENVEAAPGVTMGDLLRLLVAKHGDPMQKSVFRNDVESRSTAQVCLDRGLDLARIVTCPTECRILGDLNDPSQQRSKYRNQRQRRHNGNSA